MRLIEELAVGEYGSFELDAIFCGYSYKRLAEASEVHRKAHLGGLDGYVHYDRLRQ
jgi:hypothetical protein